MNQTTSVGTLFANVYRAKIVHLELGFNFVVKFVKGKHGSLLVNQYLGYEGKKVI